MIARNLVSKCVFASNPIVLWDDWDGVKDPGTAVVNIGYEEVYRGRFTPPVDLDLSEIAASVHWYPEAKPGVQVLWQWPDEMSDRFLKAEFTVQGQKHSWSGFIVPGGVPKQAFKFFAAKGTDAMKHRFMNNKSNFFLTTRSDSWLLVMDETELSPLYFIARAPELKLTAFGKTIVLPMEGELFALDVAEARKAFFKQYGMLPSVIDVALDRGMACRIVIEKAKPAVERYRLKFRNSLGVYEIMSIEGEMAVAPSFAEDDGYSGYDDIWHDYADARQRRERKVTLSIETEVKGRDKWIWLEDMLSSPDVWLLDAGEPVKVLPEAEQMKYSLRPKAPGKVSLKLRLCEADANVMQRISDLSQSRKPEVFANQFTNQFN